MRLVALSNDKDTFTSPAGKFGNTYKQYIWVIDQVWGQDGWILTKFFYCEFMDRDGVELHKLAKKEREATIQPSWPNKPGQ